MSVNARLRSVVAAVLGVAEDLLSDESSPRTLEKWDSIGHIQLVLAVEAEFGVQFDPDEIPDLASVRALREAVERLAAA